MVAPDGTVITLNNSGKLFVIAPDGTVRWTAQLGPVLRASASLAPDGTIYVPSIDGNLYAVSAPTGASSEGTIKWTFDFGANLGPTPLFTGSGAPGANGVGSGSSAAVGPDGTIYVGANNSNFYAIKPDGSLKWMFEAEREVAGIWADPALNADASTVYFGANKGGVYAVDTSNGTLRWQSKIFGSLYGGMTLDAKNTIYTGSTVGHFFGIDATNGQWLFDFNADAYPGIWTSAAIRPDGSVALGTRKGQVLLFGA
jgi:outer membrane protein assembly factor BamB